LLHFQEPGEVSFGIAWLGTNSFLGSEIKLIWCRLYGRGAVFKVVVNNFFAERTIAFNSSWTMRESSLSSG